MKPAPRENSTAMTRPQQVSIAVDEKRRVSGLLQVPSAARVCFVLAHGAPDCSCLDAANQFHSIEYRVVTLSNVFRPMGLARHNASFRPMSAFCTSRTSHLHRRMSAIGGK